MTNVSDKEAKDKLDSLVSQLENLESAIKEKQELLQRSEQQKDEGYGRNFLYALPSWRGTLKDIDIEELNQNLLEIATNHSKRREDDPGSIMYQDHLIEVGDNGPVDPLINEACSQIMDGFVEFTNMPAMFHTDMWTIANGPNEQIWPHAHNFGDYDYAVVCWTQVPENSGELLFFPFGLGISDEITAIRVTPKAGDFLIFPGRVLHGVRHNASTEYRVSFSGNISADPRNMTDFQNDMQLIHEPEASLADVVPLLE